MLADEPGDIMLAYMLGMEHVSEGADEKAVTIFRELTARADYVPAHHMAGQALQRLGRLDEACQALRDGIAAARRQGDFHALGEMDALLSTME
jgi:Flp pilus assembly protein TadD